MTVKILIPIAIAAAVSLIVSFLQRRPIGRSTMHGRYLLQLLQRVLLRQQLLRRLSQRSG